MWNQTRREFLEQSLLAASAALATQAVPHASAAPVGSKSPNERLRVAILGLNGRGRSHLGQFLRRSDCEVAAIVDPDSEVGMKNGVAPVEKRTGKKPAFYQDLRKAFDDNSIDIVSIATPNHWHALAAIWAIQSGKDVYVEKPVSHNVSEGRRIVQAARHHKRICQVGTQCRSMSGTTDAIQFIHDGKIGDVKLARGLCYKRRKSIGARGKYDVPSSVDYSVWLGPAADQPLSRPRFHYDWHWQWDFGNGDLGNQGIHQMDLARFGLGVDNLGDSVVSYGGRLGYVDAGDTANTQVSIHTFGDKTLVFETRGLDTSDYRGARVGNVFYGSEGYVVLDRYNHGTAFDLDGQRIAEFSGGGDNAHFDNFVDAVRSRNVDDLRGDILEGHLSSALCHLGNISYRLGKEASVREVRGALSGDEAHATLDRTEAHLKKNSVDLEATPLALGAKLALNGKDEVFVGEMADVANPMLTREYRKPFVVPAANEV